MVRGQLFIAYGPSSMVFLPIHESPSTPAAHRHPYFFLRVGMAIIVTGTQHFKMRPVVQNIAAGGQPLAVDKSETLRRRCRPAAVQEDGIDPSRHFQHRHAFGQVPAPAYRHGSPAGKKRIGVKCIAVGQAGIKLHIVQIGTYAGGNAVAQRHKTPPERWGIVLCKGANSMVAGEQQAGKVLDTELHGTVEDTKKGSVKGAPEYLFGNECILITVSSNQ